MKLQKLEIKGFKSFADKTVIHFNDNITGIIGPNGCGKSNVVDAIRWVLGEQKTSQLRLEKMDNVLFNGTKSRKASGMAEVSLTFDNTKKLLTTEFQEVTITRKLYRTGESEYRINDVQCRLKDISNLFVDSGIGSDSYAIIELGMVDEILQNKEQSRKKLFEQASSISKYKIRKKESLSKLKSTEESLERLQDILAEIESNLKALESQARRAERYNQIKADYMAVSIECMKSQVLKYKEGYNNIFKERQSADDTKKEFEAKIAASDANIQNHKRELLIKEELLTSVQKTVNSLLSGIGKNENERNLLKEQIANLLKSNETMKATILSHNIELETIQSSIKLLQEEVNGNQTRYAELTENKSKIKLVLDDNEKNFLDNKSLVELDKSEFSDIQRQVFEADKEKSILQSQILQVDVQLQNIESDYESAYLQNEEISHAFTQIKKLKDNSETTLNSVIKREDELKTSIEKLGEKLNENKIALNQIYRKADSKKNEYNLLKAMIENLEGYPDSIKFVKKNLSLFKDKNLFSDLVSCDEEFKIALEAVISNYASFFVVDTIVEGIHTVQKLKENNAGKVGLFVLELIDQIPVTPPKLHGQFIPLISIVKVEDKYKKLANVLFSHIYLVDDLENLTDFKEFASRNDIVMDRKGTVILDQKSIFGGSTSLFDGSQVGRNNSLEQLLEEIKNLDKEVAIAEHENNKINKELEAIRAKSNPLEILQKREEFSKHNDNFQKNSVLIDQLKMQLETLTLKKNDLNANKAVWNSQIAVLESEYLLLNEKMLLLRSKNEVNEQALETYLTTYNTIKEEYSAVEIEYNTLSNMLTQKQDQIDFYTKKLDSTNLSIQLLEKTIADNFGEHEEKSGVLSRMEMDILANYTDKEKLESDVQNAEKDYFTARNQTTEFENQIKELQAMFQRHNELIGAMDSKIQEMRLELQSVKERLKIEFNIELDQFMNGDLSLTMAPDEIENKIAYFRKRLETYGEINPIAIESYNEMKKRYDFLTEQKEDILVSKNNLLETIREIDTNAKERFLESFHQIRDHFIRTFRILFTEDDDCDLILVDPDNPIDSDIEIIAKPKGKKPLTINQLSGGEKTLTATALLFSLYLLKPAPFCIFDEVDAPLDDTNIAKFNKIIDEFSKNSQFIIVTHNKQTMASLDVLYGVTMIEQGVSRVVPVDFRMLQQAV
jgi:chromosome segregation protein